MRAAHRLRKAFLLTLAATFAASCDNTSITAPPVADPPERAASFGVQGASGVHLLSRGRSESARSATRRIDARGGVVAVDGALLIVPAGALSRAVDVTLTVPGGDLVQADLQPHGLRFNRAVTLAFHLGGTNVRPDAAPTVLQGVYFLSASGGVVTPSEVFTVFQFGPFAAFQTTHFSQYGLFKGFILVGG